ncbi:MAG TPA: FHA domain-containing protein [Anaerolineae bacterium]|nr:FHA domain-containing protein [Anaerolineae bacterium]
MNPNPRVCPNQHLVSNPNAKFCPQCGALLPAAGNLSPGGAPAIPPTQRMSPTIPKLRIQIPGQQPYEVELTKPIVTLGRAPGNDIQISDPYVGNQHARLEQVQNTFRIVDLKSKNKTLVNGRDIQEQLLNSGDIIRIGDVYGNFVGITFLAASAVVPPRPPVTLNLRQADTTIGRDPTCTLVLHDRLVSGRHAQIHFDGQRHFLTDLASMNGTYVNGTRLPPNKPYSLHANDLVQIGSYQFRYDRAGISSANLQGMRLDGKNLSVQRDNRLILNDVTLCVYPREFIGLVGASGAGKSTLMNALSGYRRAPQGKVLINGTDFYAAFDTFRSRIGYVPQDDILHKSIPVKRALRYAAELRLAPGTDLDARVDQVLDVVELTEHQDKAIQKLSGGQRKRASIAVELLAEPGLFFLDEPTSGLDPGLEKKMMERMRVLADNGQTVILVTHATANINQCDYVAFMANGRLVFFGRPDEVKAFFGKDDFADIYSELAYVDPQDHDRIARECEMRFQNSPYYQAYIQQRVQNGSNTTPPPPPRPKPPLWKQWWVLTRRQFDLILRDWLTLFIVLLVLPVIGLLVLRIAKPDFLIGLSASEIAQLDQYSPAGDAQKLIFIIALAAVLLGIFAAAYEIVREQVIYKRERMVNLDIVPYVLAKVLVLFLFSLVQAALFLAIISRGVTLPDDGVLMWGPLEMYVTLVLATLSSIALGLFISAVARSENMVIYIILLVLFLQIMFAGVIFELPDEAKPLSYLTTTHWTIDALGSTVNIRQLHEDKTKLPKPDLPECPPQLTAAVPPCMHSPPANAPAPKPDPKDLPKLPIDYDHQSGHLLSRWFILLLFTAIFLGLSFIAQRAKDEPSPVAIVIEKLKPIWGPFVPIWHQWRRISPRIP